MVSFANELSLDGGANRRRWLTFVLVMWGVLAAVSCVKAVVQPVKHTVYPYFSHAARHWWSDLDLYAHYEGFDPFRYSPTFAVAMTPFGLVPDELGGVAWNLLSIGLLLLAVRALVREVLPGNWTPANEALLLGLTLVGSVRGVWSAQSNAVVLALVIFGMTESLRGRWWRASLLLALPAFIKIWPAAVCLLLVMRWPKQLTWRLGVTTAALAFVPFLTRPWSVVWHQYESWWVTLTGPLQGRWGGYRDAWTIWEELFPPVDPHAYRWLQLASFAGLALWCFWMSHREPSSRTFLTYTLAGWTAWQLFLGPGTERLTYGLVAPAMAWAVVVSFETKRLRWLTVTAFLCTYILGAGEVERAILKIFPYAKIIPPLGVAMFLGWIAVKQWLDRREASQAIDSDVTWTTRESSAAA